MCLDHALDQALDWVLEQVRILCLQGPTQVTPGCACPDCSWHSEAAPVPRQTYQVPMT